VAKEYAFHLFEVIQLRKIIIVEEDD